MKKTIKCKFANGMTGTRKVLEELYDVIETEEPDFAFFSGADTQKCYKYDCVRILEMGENQRPDFNLFDYAYGFDKITFEDRYLYYPLYANVQYKGDMDLALKKHTYSDEYYLSKNKFCGMVISNAGSASESRIQFFRKLSEYKKVDSGGRSFNNLPDGKPVSDKLDFLQNYKFSLAFENSSYKGYATEKIIQAFAAGTIPIYWGDPSIAEQFNQKAFVNCHNYDNWDEVVQAIKEIDENETLYLNMQKEAICGEDSIVRQLISEEYFREWLCHIVDQNPNKALKRTNAHVGWGYYVERNARYFDEMSSSKLVRIAYAISKRISRNVKSEKKDSR